MKLNRILETTLDATNLDEMEAFYTRLLSREPYQKEPGRFVFYKLEEAMFLLFNPEATVQPPAAGARLPVPPHGTSGAGHLCFSGTGDEIECWKAHLEDNGVAVEADFNWPSSKPDEPTGGRSIYFRDPAGNSLEIAEPRIWGL